MKKPRDRLYGCHRLPAVVIRCAGWLHFRFPLPLQMVEGLLAATGIDVNHEVILR